MRKIATRVLWVILIGCFISPAKAEQAFVQTSCRSGECVWSSMGDPITIAKQENGVLIGVTSRFCVEPGGKYPANYRCQASVILTSDAVAFCSRSFPSIATKNGQGKWERTRLSISDDGYGYNRQFITDYLRICHGHIRGVRAGPSLDMIGAKFGYKSRYDALGDKEHDTVDRILDLAE